MPARSAGWVVRSAVAADIEAIAELRATVLRADLERLGRYDEHRVRQRLRDSFSTQHTSIIMIGRELAGCVTVRPAGDRQWLEHLYLAPHRQGQGLGSATWQKPHGFFKYDQEVGPCGLVSLTLRPSRGSTALTRPGGAGRAAGAGGGVPADLLPQAVQALLGRRLHGEAILDLE
ncbi:GNAT family N-acetyltransferase [Streptomyces sp. CNZ748]